MNVSATQLYYKQMVEVKSRFLAIDRILGAKKGKARTLTEDYYDNEFMWLQLRMIVELVTFSAIASDRERYIALRRQQDATSNYEKDWRAEKILGHLSNINPKFLPQALGRMQMQPDGTKHFEGVPQEQQATLYRLVSIHQTAGEYLHSANPFDANAEQRKTDMRVESRERIIADHVYLKTILAEHYKVGLEFKEGDDPKGLDNPKHAWIVVLGKSEVSSIQMIQAEARPNGA
jgi:hypothetical protein